VWSTWSSAGISLSRRYLTDAVLRADAEHCTVCRLGHVELLEAAHILPDTHPRGEAVVPNGLALCKLHHAAFDANILGIRPDYTVDLRLDVLEEIDGPMLKHGLQGFQGQRLRVVPSAARLKPNREFLEERYALFRSGVNLTVFRGIRSSNSGVRQCQHPSSAGCVTRRGIR
jgi:putative restriction endonuclease